MYTRDGIRLDADIYRPDAEGKFPVLLMRQPYGRAIASTVVYAHPRWYAAQGYIVVIQDVRGRGTSAGEFKLFAHEIADGEDAVNWAASLPGSNGAVGMYGFSYQGMTQLYAAAAKPAALKAICPAMIGYDLYTDWAYEGGAFCLHTNLAWAMQLATETARLRGDKQAYQALLAASRNLPLYDPIPTRPEVLQNLAPDSFYHEWIEHSQPDAYWENLSPKTHLQNIDLPMFHIGGWFDTYLRGTLSLYKEMAARSHYRQQLLVGPWAHLPWGRKVGEVDFGVNAISPVDRMQICWFDQFLKGIDTGLTHQLPVWLFEMGSNTWQGFLSFPEFEHKPYFLSSYGIASIREDEGILTTACPENGVDDVLVHDPWRPVPSLGGHAGIPAGVFERSHIDCRSDVLTYTSEPLDFDLHLAGDVVVAICCSADKPSFDLSVVLSEIYPDGKVYNLTQGYLRCQDGMNHITRKIQLQTTCACIARGNALRLSISAACFPAYAINPGNNSSMGIEAEIITLTISCGGTSLSQILLPVIAGS
ncbi:S15 family X-Pro dipeptidyl-peptidase [Fischerella thermalis CCMEE 5268]|uniref:S15 family X-Pro dipeptidyl-peptidase n=1 Tax=Fischerella thermalis CCMEE 5268 TaxID=2019662 RepID=A0A2N6KC34_9CYAN|nr:CocE/NonD family hydrolase [Fischerella thermalis]PLZ96041.1 S15 family X-Pro dipeptidyl-peptidase [Fischerella thermalis CCMEE 5268]